MSGKRYNWAEVQAYYDEVKNGRACIRHFGMSTKTWESARLSGRIKVVDRITPVEVLLARDDLGRSHVKKRLIRLGLLRKQCYLCGLKNWRGKPLSLHLDHVNGKKNDWRLDNLRLLCPNCHSQTETYGGKNKKPRRIANGK